MKRARQLSYPILVSFSASRGDGLELTCAFVLSIFYRLLFGCPYSLTLDLGQFVGSPTLLGHVPTPNATMWCPARCGANADCATPTRRSPPSSSIEQLLNRLANLNSFCSTAPGSNEPFLSSLVNDHHNGQLGEFVILDGFTEVLHG